MKVLYDTTVLGASHINPRSRTGVFRVAENLAYGLHNLDEFDLEFCVSGHQTYLFAFLDYLKENPTLANVPIHHSWGKRYFSWKALRQVDAQVKATSGPLKIPLRAARKLLTIIENISNNSNYDPISSKSISHADIYHSPFEPIPDKVSQAPHLKKFLSVMDLIPILFPDYFKFHEGTIVERAIASLDPDSWALCISHSTKDDLCNYAKHVDPAKVLVTHLAASNLFYPCTSPQQIEQVRAKYSIPDVPYLLSLSTLEPRKNIDHLIRCFAQLVQQEKLQDLYLVLVGTKGWNYDQIFAEISNNSALQDRIIVTGYVADEDLAALYSSAMAFVYPSFYEGFGLPPLEAMQCGIPVITSNTSSLPEVVGDAGIMLDPKDQDGLCHRLLQIYTDTDLRQTMSRQSLEQAKKFSWERCTQETIAAYKQALST